MLPKLLSALVICIFFLSGESLRHTIPAGCSMPTGQKYHFSCRITNILDKIRTLRNVPMRLSCREKGGANRMLGRTSRVFQTRRRLSRAARSGLAFRRQQGGNKRKKGESISILLFRSESDAARHSAVRLPPGRVHRLRSDFFIRITELQKRATVSRWVTRTSVLPCSLRARRCRSVCSVGPSSAEVGSSSSRMPPGRSSPRAMAMRCACPSLRPAPCSPHRVLSPSGRDRTKSAAAVCSAVSICSSVACGFPHPQVVAYGSAHQRVALRHEGQVASCERGGACFTGRVIESDGTLVRFEQGQNQSDQSAFPGPCFPDDGGHAARGKIVCEVVEYDPTAVRVGVGKVLDADSGREAEPLSGALLLPGQKGQFRQTFCSGENPDECGNMAAQIHHRPLDMCDQLEKCRHHAERHGTVTQSEYAPQQGCGITGHEACLDHRPGEDREIGAPHDPLLQVRLQFREAGDGLFRIFERADQDAVLQVLLHVALDGAVRVADLVRHPAHPPHVAFC